MGERPAVLEVKNLETGYGDVQVLWDVNLEVHKGETVALIGPNGAGKTTLLNTICGLLEPRAGAVLLEGEDLSSVPGHDRTRRGVVQIPEGRKLFSGMTVTDNLSMGAYCRRDKNEVRGDMAWAFELFPELVPLKDRPAGSLSGGQQQMCAIARGLMARPRYLLIDEMSLGVAPVIVDRLIVAIRDIQAKADMGLLIVEQDVGLALELADRGYVLETGRMVGSGRSAELLDDPRITEAYLGVA
ncbi:MAG: ABC transporter ATP-binding protein [Thermoleophilia bacterium]|nr:ABC transporter ATP-binding protein [Thermoleophilia bacterium]